MTSTRYQFPEKKCACGRTHTTAGAGQVVEHDSPLDGLYFNCECQSTLFIKIEDLWVITPKPEIWL